MAELKGNYDAVVIGAGLGGLTCGALLAKNGFSVLVAEQGPKVGGCCASFEHEGFAFDNGLCFLLGCEPGAVVYQTLVELNLLGNIEFIKMEPSLRIIGSNYDLKINSAESLGDQLVELFPMETAAIRKFTAGCATMGSKAEMFLNKSLDLMNIWQKIAFLFTFLIKHRMIIKYMRKPAREVVNDFFDNPKLRAILHSIPPYIDPTTMSFLKMGGIGFTKNKYYPKGGFQALADLLANGLIKYDGNLVLNTMVNKIIVEDNRATGVELSDGRQVKARYIISNADAKQTFFKLVGEEHLSLKFRQELNESQLLSSYFVVSLGISLNLNGFDGAYIAYNPSEDIGELFGTDPEKCIVGITLHSNLDPSRAPDGMTAVEIEAMLPYNTVEDWRSEEEAIADKLIASAEKVIPKLSESIIYKHIVSPLAFEQSTLNSQGALGWSFPPGFKIRSQKTPVKNLYQAGQWTHPGGAMSTVVTSGRNVAQLVLRGK